MKLRYLLLGVAGLFVISQVPAQHIAVEAQNSTIEKILEAIASRYGETADFESLLNELVLLRQHPLDLNVATRAALEKIPFLTVFQINSLLAYREEHGVFFSLYELGMVYGFSEETIRMIIPYVTIGNNEAVHFTGSMRHEISLRTQRILEKSAGYIEDDQQQRKYPGNPWLYYARYGLEAAGHIRASITLEKDPGEEFFKGSNPHGFDFHSASITLSEIGPLKTMVAGDFRPQFGQGLTLWSGASPGKSSLALGVVKRKNGAGAFTSSDENGMFRGLVATVQAGNFEITGFYSSVRKDANITDTLPSGRICFTSFQESGYHRTEAEVADENAVRMQSMGGNIHFRGNWLKAGTTFAYTLLDKNMLAGEEPKDLYDFRGNSLLNWGIDYSATFRKLQLFGEAAIGNQAWATVDGALFNAGRHASFVLFYRYYSPGYYSFNSAAFSEGSANSNEEGMYAGTVIHPYRNWKVSAYADIFRFPWLRYRVSAPSAGTDFLVETEYAPGDIAMYMRWRYEDNPTDIQSDTFWVAAVGSKKRNSCRFQIAVPVNERLTLQSRLEAIWVNVTGEDPDRGIMVYQHADYRFKSVPVILNFRVAWFRTGSYNSRIYAYEQDMVAGFSFAPLYSEGFRTYLMARYEPGRLSYRLRIAQTNYYDQPTNGTGNDAINGPAKTEIKVQVIARF
jgi:hypothetical protein